jgi:DNA-binding GntR family transcriptional regulator
MIVFNSLSPIAEGLYQGPRESTTVDRVVIALQKAMFEGKLNPGTPLREEMLSQRFGVSRSTIREALRVLTMDGLLTRQPNRSVLVHHLSVVEVEDIFRSRLLLESACVRTIATCPDQTLQKIAHLLEVYVLEVLADDAHRAALAHVEFHTNLVYILSQSQWLAMTERSMLRHLLLILATVHKSSEDLRHEIVLHRDLCNLCVSRRVEEALACLEEGLDESKAFAIKFTFEALKIAAMQEDSVWPSGKQ